MEWYSPRSKTNKTSLVAYHQEPSILLFALTQESRQSGGNSKGLGKGPVAEPAPSRRSNSSYLGAGTGPTMVWYTR